MSDIEIGEERYGEKELSIKEIILRHIRKMSDISCQELIAGFWEERPIKIGGGVSIIRNYHPDLREAFINATDFLFYLINPYTKKEKEGKDKKRKFEERVKEINKDIDDAWKDGNKDKKDKEDKEDKTERTQDEWVQQKLNFKRELFAEIMLFLNRINFFVAKDYGE